MFQFRGVSVLLGVTLVTACASVTSLALAQTTTRLPDPGAKDRERVFFESCGDSAHPESLAQKIFFQLPDNEWWYRYFKWLKAQGDVGKRALARRDVWIPRNAAATEDITLKSTFLSGNRMPKKEEQVPADGNNPQKQMEMLENFFNAEYEVQEVDRDSTLNQFFLSYEILNIVRREGFAVIRTFPIGEELRFSTCTFIRSYVAQLLQTSSIVLMSNLTEMDAVVADLEARSPDVKQLREEQRRTARSLWDQVPQAYANFMMRNVRYFSYLRRRFAHLPPALSRYRDEYMAFFSGELQKVRMTLGWPDFMTDSDTWILRSSQNRSVEELQKERFSWSIISKDEKSKDMLARERFGWVVQTAEKKSPEELGKERVNFDAQSSFSFLRFVYAVNRQIADLRVSLDERFVEDFDSPKQPYPANNLGRDTRKNQQAFERRTRVLIQTELTFAGHSVSNIGRLGITDRYDPNDLHTLEYANERYKTLFQSFSEGGDSTVGPYLRKIGAFVWDEMPDSIRAKILKLGSGVVYDHTAEAANALQAARALQHAPNQADMSSAFEIRDKLRDLRVQVLNSSVRLLPVEKQIRDLEARLREIRAGKSDSTVAERRELTRRGNATNAEWLTQDERYLNAWMQPKRQALEALTFMSEYFDDDEVAATLNWASKQIFLVERMRGQICRIGTYCDRLADEFSSSYQKLTEMASHTARGRAPTMMSMVMGEDQNYGASEFRRPELDKINGLIRKAGIQTFKLNLQHSPWLAMKVVQDYWQGLLIGQGIILGTVMIAGTWIHPFILGFFVATCAMQALRVAVGFVLPNNAFALTGIHGADQFMVTLFVDLPWFFGLGKSGIRQARAIFAAFQTLEMKPQRVNVATIMEQIRVVMSQKLGAPTPAGSIVHPKDGFSMDPAISRLIEAGAFLAKMAEQHAWLDVDASFSHVMFGRPGQPTPAVAIARLTGEILNAFRTLNLHPGRVTPKIVMRQMYVELMTRVPEFYRKPHENGTPPGMSLAASRAPEMEKIFRAGALLLQAIDAFPVLDGRKGPGYFAAEFYSDVQATAQGTRSRLTTFWEGWQRRRAVIGKVPVDEMNGVEPADVVDSGAR